MKGNIYSNIRLKFISSIILGSFFFQSVVTLALPETEDVNDIEVDLEVERQESFTVQSVMDTYTSTKSIDLIACDDRIKQQNDSREQPSIHSPPCFLSPTLPKFFYSQTIETDTDVNPPLENNQGNGSSSLADLARKAQDPLADIAAVVSDNTLNFGVGEKNNRTGVNFQFQGVYSFNFPESGFDLIARGIANFNVVPLEQGGDAWGLGDSIGQFFFKPNLPGNWKFGIGPQFSLKTRTNDNTGGPGWGAGPVAIALGTEGSWTLGALVGQLWSFDGDFSGLTIQPLIYYNFESMPGFSLGYDPIITANWQASADNQWTVPLGLTVGQLFDLGDGYALNLFAGAYGVPIRPDNGPQWQARLQLFFLLPR